jgi:hypothetical protein
MRCLKGPPAPREVCNLHWWPPSSQLHAKALIEIPRLGEVPNIQVKMSDLCSFRRRLLLGTNFIGTKDLFEIQCIAPRVLYPIGTNECQSIANGPDTFESFRCFQGELDVDAIRIIQIDRLREGVVRRSDRVPHVGEALEHSSEVSLVRRVDGDVVETAMSL